jgi:hypothetical protein
MCKGGYCDQGAARLFKELLEPLLNSVSKDVDLALDDCAAFVVSHY